MFQRLFTGKSGDIFNMPDNSYIWETFDNLFKTVNRQGRRVEELEARIVDLEHRLSQPAAKPTAQQPSPALSNFDEMPAERAA